MIARFAMIAAALALAGCGTTYQCAADDPSPSYRYYADDDETRLEAECDGADLRFRWPGVKPFQTERRLAPDAGAGDGSR